MSRVSRHTPRAPHDASPAPRCTGIVLAGGANRRFGGLPKGLAVIDGQRVVDRVLDALRPVSDELLLITNDVTVRDALAVVTAREDLRAERSSLVGLHSALTYCRDGALVVAWDMPFVTGALLAELRRLGETASAATVPTGPEGPEPLCAYYPKRALATVERQLERGDMQLAAFLEALPEKLVLSLDRVATFGPPARLFANVNSAADLAAVQLLEGGDENAADPQPGMSAEHR